MSKPTEHHDTYCPGCKWTGSNTDLIDHPFKDSTLICPQCSNENSVNVDEIDLDDFGELEELEAVLWKNGKGS